ncbi:phenylalanine--tRNA ligase beta subunit-related protein [SCandidatus Aminicenantes bacterium Aminicenantia_JdfR_composite]|jgi:lysyl-tRNA synthetase class 2|nr:phenylalanine--tRNA ligase beta subunit-related protein [SCandidatus Aminicenantes bacterium Aminicenantia_JdfR_composite]MCP2597459.1 phenylalanine--tRNA ligase beta subunit-related protein [Candidatus Aminicenantes bacterium AC-335-G13]MCP2606386.1 phenylalanine--tRNA ligase beta subunit-related protein [Candidatus Aminicenantes bacterium AC-708-I09]
MRKIIIEKEIFSKFPDFKRGLVLIKNIENSFINEKIEKLLNEEIEKRASQQNLDHDFIKAWDEIHRKFGSNPNKYPPSIKALLKRVEKGKKIPYINSVVALFNYISLKYLIPCGGDDVEKIEGNSCLGFAKGNEIFVPLGTQEQENPEPGEIIYYDDRTLNVMCRKWNWRNGDFSKITENSKKIIINVDGAGIVPESVIKQARDELAELLKENCRADLTTDLLNSEKNEIAIDF